MIHDCTQATRTLRAVLAGLLVAAMSVAGCGPTCPPEDLLAFEQADPLRPTVDLGGLTKAKQPSGPYRVVVDDVLALHMPIVTLDLAATPEAESEPVLCRITPAGTIRLPVAGEIPVAGKTLAEVEAAVVAAYCPKYVKRIPAVTAEVSVYCTSRVSVIGVVKEPGIHELRSDEMSLVAALMKAGGIVPEGAGAIRIRPAGADEAPDAMLLPVKGMNIPFADVALKGGETIEVEGLDQHTFTVVGLVKKPGMFPYRPGTQYSLAQALAAAEGVDPLADPKYAKICRQDAAGRFIAVPFPISHGALARAANVQIKPGDVIAVEQTADTDARMVVLHLLRLSAGIHASAN